MKIIAIGGGEIGRPGTKIETLAIDKEIIKISGKKHPKLLFLPTASSDNENYYKVIEKYFGKRLGCKTDVLYLIKSKPPKKEIERKIMGSEIIYVGGGNTMKMLKIWRKNGLDKILKRALDKGIVLSGISAGAICWFKYGNSDSLKFSDKRNPLIKLRGLNYAPLMVCPHYDVEKSRRSSLKKMIKEKGGVAIALENCTALEILDNKCRILISSRKSRAYKLYKQNGKVIEEKIPNNEYILLNELNKK